MKRAAHALLDAVGEERILAMRAGGATVEQVAQACDVGAGMLLSWLGPRGGGASGDKRRAVDEDDRSRRDRWDEASERGVEAVASEAVACLDLLVDPATGRMLPEVAVAKEEITLQKERAAARLKRADRMAAALDAGRARSPGGGLVGAGGTVNIGTLHLVAVQQLHAGARAALAAPGEVVEEAEVVEVEETH